MSNQIYFIDSKLNNYQTIIDSLSPTDIYYVIDLKEDGLTQISNILSDYSNLDSIHLYSHGDVGSLNLGNSIVDNTNIDSYEVELENIGKSLSITGDILLYGCNVGETLEGQSFINTLASYTNADVAASNDLTGNLALLGDWDLEVNNGIVETQVNSVEEYKSTLATNSAPTFIIGDGKVTTDFGALFGGVGFNSSMAIQSDDKILISGSVFNRVTWNNDFSLVRYNNGTLDTSFSSDGLVTTDFKYWDEGKSITLQSDGKILVAGRTDGDFAIARYNTDGGLDTSFDLDGKVTTDFKYWDEGVGITLQSNGKILVAGNSSNLLEVSSFTVIRYNEDGSLDETFGVNGIVTTKFDSYNGYVNSMTIQSDDRILVAGSAGSGFSIVRFNSNGSLDTSFSADGKVTTDFGRNDFGKELIIQPDGKILFVGKSGPFGASDITIARYNKNGSLDTTFGYYGKVITDFGKDEHANSIAVQSDGKILVAGYFYNDSISNDDFLIVRYNKNGSLDTTFGYYGTVVTDFNNERDYANKIIIQSDGKILVSGISGDDFAIARYNTDGSLDTSFGNTGSVAENAATSTVIYKATASDVDGDTLTYSLDGTDSTLLNINSTTGEVTLKSSANYEVKNSYSFNVIASDGSLTDTKAVTVNVNNVNEYKPTITSTSTGSVAENAATSTVIYKATASDVDGDTLTYSLDGTDSTLLNINSTTGEVTLKSSANYEVKNSYSFNVIASDGSLTDTKAVTVNVNNVYEEKIPMKINFKYNSNLRIDEIETILNISSKNFEDMIYGDGDVFTSNSKIVYKEGSIILTINGSGFTSDSGDFTVKKINFKFSDGESYSMSSSIEGNIYYDDLSDILSNVKVTKLMHIIPYGTGKFLTETITGDNFYSEYVTSDIKNFKYEISDGVGGKITFSTSLLKAEDYNYIMNDSISLKEKVEYFSDSTFLDSDDKISIVKSTDLFLNEDGNPVLNGYEGNDTLTGSSTDDIIDGGTGIDKMIGGLGNDTYYVDNIKDKIIETSSGGIDTVNSTITYTLSKYLENIKLIGTSNIDGTGNNSDNTILGNSGNNILDGKKGKDIMLGGAGDDKYYVDNVNDEVYETTDLYSMIDEGGIDTVNSLVSYTIGDYVENLTLMGKAKINAIGNDLDNTIIGNSSNNILEGQDGNDILIGGLGSDILTGGFGEDNFIFNSKLSSKNIDTITDFDVFEDSIVLDNDIFKKLEEGLLNIDNFVSNSTGKALDSNDFLIYNSSNGKLFYDVDGNGKAKAIQIALIENKIDLTYSDFTVI